MMNETCLRVATGLTLAWCTATMLGCGDSSPSQGQSGAGAPAGGTSGATSGPMSGTGPTAGGTGVSAGASAGGASSTAGRASGGTDSLGGAAGKGSGGAGGGAAGVGGSQAGAGPMVDCAAAPTKPTAVKDVAGARAYHGIAFDGAGSLIGAHGGTIYKATTSSSKILAAGFSDVQGIDRFPNGDFAVVATESEDNSSLVRITDAGAQDKLAEVSYDAYGVRVVPSGWVYVGQPEGLLLVNAATKETRTVDVPASPRVMDYSPDRQRLYVGTLTADLGEDPADGLGPIYVFDLDATNLPVGKARLFASNVGGGWHDGLGVDACGNLFVADYSTSGLYRVTPKGDVSLFHQWTETSYGHGLSWGSGVGGWNKLSLYQPQPYNEDTVVEVVVGVPARAP